MNTQEGADTRIVDPARLPFTYQDALNAGDADAVVALFHQDATMHTFTGKVLTDRQALHAEALQSIAASRSRRPERRRLSPAGRPMDRGGSPSSIVNGQLGLRGGRSRFRRGDNTSCGGFGRPVAAALTCGVTHVVLLVRRADVAVVIGAALAAKAAGDGYRVIAALLGRPAETVRGWLRRFAGRVEAVRGVFTVWLRALAPDPVMPAPAGSGWADALVAIVAAAQAAVGRFVLPEVSVWEVATVVSDGRLLAPGWPPVSINTSCP